MPQKVVQLDRCRDLLSQVAALREEIIRGEVTAIASCVKRINGQETVSFCGEYREDADSAVRAALAMSMELNRRSKRRG